MSTDYSNQQAVEGERAHMGSGNQGDESNGASTPLIERTERIDSQSKKYWRERFFSPMERGSLRSSTFTLMSAAIGLAVLSLPHALMEAGIVFGSVCLLIGCAFAYWTLNALTDAGFEEKKLNYSDLVYHQFGKRGGDIFQYLFLTYLFGIITSFQITGASFVNSSLSIVGLSDGLLNGTYERAIQIVIFNICLYPLACFKDLYFLRYGSMLIIAAISYTLFVIILQAPDYINRYSSSYAKTLTYANFNLDGLSAFSVGIFAFACHSFIFPVRKELARPEDYRMEKIIRRAVSFELVIYLCMAIFGYLTTLNDTPDLIVNREPLGGTNILMSIAQIALIASPVVAIPLKINPTRLQFSLLTGMEENTKNRYLLTAVILLLTGSIAIVFPNVYAAVTILAGTVGCLINFSIPASIYIARRKEMDVKKVLAIIVTVISTILAWTSAVNSFINSV